MSSESVQPDLDARTLRAASEHMTVIEEADAFFEVTSQSGRAYMVDLREPVCECPDFRYRAGEIECKHIRRVRMEVGQVDVDALEESITAQAATFQQRAQQLAQAAEELDGSAAELEAAIGRLREVAGR